VYFVGVALALIAAAFLLTDALFGPRPAATEMNVRRVLPGMSFPEVTTVLGPPARGSAPLRPGFAQTIAWGGEQGDVVITFGQDGKVSEKHFLSPPSAQPR
jgi:hypothetical protein